MQTNNMNEPDRSSGRTFPIFPILTLVFALAAIAATYFLSTVDLDPTIRLGSIGGVMVLFLAVCGTLYFQQSKRRRLTDAESEPEPEPVDIEAGLGALDEASSFFTGSIRSADAFRLVSSRVRDIFPFQTIVLFLLNENRTQLVSVHAEGAKSEHYKGQMLSFEDGLAGQAYKTHQVEIDGYLMLDSEQEYGSSVAIPLINGDNVFGVTQLYFDEAFDVTATDSSLYEAVGTRVAPLMLGSIAYERSQANALTDVTTDLPNERAFYLVLENQVAEAQRKRDDRPLTVLAIDIKNFDEVNCTFGHVAGDKVLNFVARVIKDNLRQMDFVARAMNDEFLVILPTASKEISHDIIARINTGFLGHRLAINESQAVEVQLNIGWAAFGSDGETPGQLLSLAQLRKEQMKSTGPSNLLFFPMEQREAVR
ncbi:MAG: sensor domain-containing diguanylate cyclase [Pyrinomonadaceae bacterium]